MFIDNASLLLDIYLVINNDFVSGCIKVFGYICLIDKQIKNIITFLMYTLVAVNLFKNIFINE